MGLIGNILLCANKKLTGVTTMLAIIGVMTTLEPSTDNPHAWFAYKESRYRLALDAMDIAKQGLGTALAEAIEAGKADAWKYANREIKENPTIQAARKRIVDADAAREKFIAKNRYIEEALAEYKGDPAKQLAELEAENAERDSGCVLLRRDPNWLDPEPEPEPEPKEPWLDIGEYLDARFAQLEARLYKKRN
jgi:hypothetical protein